MQPTIHNVFENVTGTWQYIVADPSTSTAVIIDPVLNYDPATQAITTQSADALLSLVQENGYKISRILETHAHADHLTSSSYLQSRISQIQGHKPPIGIGKRIEQVQKLFSKRYGLTEDEYTNVFDILFDDDETFPIGTLTAKAIHLPGHTPDHLGYQIGGKQPSPHQPRSKTNTLQIMSSAATPSSTQTSAQPAATSPAATQNTYSNQGANYYS
jgi:glyoxylase-like metal-dependent hydrolase (beta-lactamase superfamily II)